MLGSIFLTAAGERNAITFVQFEVCAVFFFRIIVFLELPILICFEASGS